MKLSSAYWLSKIFDAHLDFEELSLELFLYQSNHIPVYKSYLEFLRFSPKKIKSLLDIPFLPIDAFKNKQIYPSGFSPKLIFKSSGTTATIENQRSIHFIVDTSVYEKSIIKNFENTFGKVTQYDIVALLPSYTERKDASLIYMVNHLMMRSKNIQNAFFLTDYDALISQIERSSANGKKTILFGVSFALIDLLKEKGTIPHEISIIETGGMKGRKEELIKSQFIQILTTGFPNAKIYSEYGMTELLSQAYAKDGLNFICPPQMNIYIREAEDPFSYLPHGKPGGINIIDLANIYSCAFIATDDIGTFNAKNNTFQVLGRLDQSDVRGCSQLIS